VTTTDVVGAGTIYVTPDVSDEIALYTGGAWKVFHVAELPIALAGLGLADATNYDVFLYDNAGAADFELSAAWASATVRTDALARQDGVLVKAADPTRRHVGAFRTTSTTTTEDSEAKRFLSNRYNLAVRKLKHIETTDTWTYSTATWRQANADANNAVEHMTCDEARFFVCDVQCMNDSTNGPQVAAVGVGIDSTTVNSADAFGYYTTAETGVAHAKYRGYPGLGYRKSNWLEIGNGTGTQHFFGDNGNPTAIQSGMLAEILG